MTIKVTEKPVPGAEFGFPKDSGVAWENFVTIDPGLAGTGIAIWKNKNLTATNFIATEASSLLYERMDEIAWFLKHLIFAAHCKKIFVECPRFFQSAKGVMVASAGDLVKLTLLVGFITGRLGELGDVLYIDPGAWKGALPDEIIRSRIVERLGEKFSKEKIHVLDAVAMGLWLQGKF